MILFSFAYTNLRFIVTPSYTSHRDAKQIICFRLELDPFSGLTHSAGELLHTP